MVANLTNGNAVVYPHTHAATDIQQLEQAINEAVANSTAPIGKDRLPTDTVYIGGLSLVLGDKSDVGHKHVITDVNGLSTALQNKADLVGGKIPLGQLPSTFVQEVVSHPNKTDFPTAGNVNVLYVETSTNKLFYWSGTAYLELTRTVTDSDSVPEGTNNLYLTTARRNQIQDAIDVAKTTAINAIPAQVTAGLGPVNLSIQELNTKTTTLQQDTAQLKAKKTVVWNSKTTPEIQDMTKDQYTALGTYSDQVLYLIVEP